MHMFMDKNHLVGFAYVPGGTCRKQKSVWTHNQLLWCHTGKNCPHDYASVCHRGDLLGCK